MSSHSVGHLQCTVLLGTAPDSASLPRLGREIRYSSTCVPSFAGGIAERVYSMSGLRLCLVHSL